MISMFCFLLISLYFHFIIITIVLVLAIAIIIITNSGLLTVSAVSNIPLSLAEGARTSGAAWHGCTAGCWPSARQAWVLSAGV